MSHSQRALHTPWLALLNSSLLTNTVAMRLPSKARPLRPLAQAEAPAASANLTYTRPGALAATASGGGYRYWSTGASAPAPPPVRLDGDAAATTTTAPAGASAWNAAGTWEERDFTSRGKEAFKRAVAARGGEGTTFTVTSVSGHASVVFVRGAPRPGVEFEDVAIAWEATEGGKGVARAASLSSTDCDDVEVTFDGGRPPDGGAALAAAVGSALAEVVEAMRGWV